MAGTGKEIQKKLSFSPMGNIVQEKGNFTCKSYSSTHTVGTGNNIDNPKISKPTLKIQILKGSDINTGFQYH